MQTYIHALTLALFLFVAPVVEASQGAKQVPDAPATRPKNNNTPKLLQQFRSLSIHCRTVWMPNQELEKALQRRGELKYWGVSVVPKGQQADLAIEIDRPLMTFEWTFQIAHGDTKANLGSGKVTAFDGPSAAPLLAGEIVRLITEVRPVRVAPGGTLAAPLGRQWKASYVAGSENVPKDARVDVSVTQERILIAVHDANSVSIPTGGVVAVGFISSVKNPAERWDRFWNDFLTGDSGAATLILFPAIAGGEVLLQAGQTVHHYIRLDWVEDNLHHHAVLCTEDREHETLLPELEAATYKDWDEKKKILAGLDMNKPEHKALVAEVEESSPELLNEGQPMSRTLCQRLCKEQQNRWEVRLDRPAFVGWTELKPGTFQVVVLMRGSLRGEIYFLPRKGVATESVLAQWIVEVEQRPEFDVDSGRLGASEQPELTFLEENGVARISMIRTKNFVMNLVPLPKSAPN